MQPFFQASVDLSYHRPNNISFFMAEANSWVVMIGRGREGEDKGWKKGQGKAIHEACQTQRQQKGVLSI
jgi:hypothetical protein